MKYLLVGLAFAVIVGSLVSAGVYMLRAGSDPKRAAHMARALAVRVAVSVLLFVCILLAWRLGWIQPSGVPIGH